MAVKSTRKPNLGTQAQRDAAIQFAPKRSALSEALQNAREEYGSTVQAGKSTAKLTQQAAAAALPQISQIYSKADAARQAGATLLSSDLAGLSGVADTQKAGAASEVQAQLANLISARARDEGQLTKAGTAAAAGAQFNELNARQTLLKAVKGILGKQQTTADEEGSVAASETSKLAHEQREAERQEREAQLSADTSRANSEEGTTATRSNNKEDNATSEANNKRSAAASGGSGGDYTAPGVKKGTTDQHNSARDTIEKIRHEAYEMRHDEHVHFNDAKAELEEPVPKLRSAYSNNGQLKAALELAYFGGISDGTIGQLHKEGLSVKQLGYPRYRKVNGVPRLERIK